MSYHFSSSNQSQTQRALPQKNLHIQRFVHRTMNYDWRFPCVQTCIKLNLEPSPPDLVIRSCRHGKYKITAVPNNHQLSLPASIYCINVAQSADCRHTHTSQNSHRQGQYLSAKMTPYVCQISQNMYFCQNLYSEFLRIYKAFLLHYAQNGLKLINSHITINDYSRQQ